MTGLTIKQEAFCQAYIETGNASEAYRSAYAADKIRPEAARIKAAKQPPSKRSRFFAIITLIFAAARLLILSSGPIDMVLTLITKNHVARAF